MKTVPRQTDVLRRDSRTAFERSAKRRQQQFRDTSSTVSDQGRSPTDDKGIRNPHLLALGYEVENLFPGVRGGGGAIDFFSQRGIKWWKSSRSGDDSKVDGPTRNMASSQVACVNFLLPLVSIPGALLTALRPSTTTSAMSWTSPTGGTRLLLSSSGSV